MADELEMGSWAITLALGSQGSIGFMWGLWGVSILRTHILLTIRKQTCVQIQSEDSPDRVWSVETGGLSVY